MDYKISKWIEDGHGLFVVQHFSYKCWLRDSLIAIGVYYVEFLAVFNESNGQTAWISSLKYDIQGAMGMWNYFC